MCYFFHLYKFWEINLLINFSYELLIKNMNLYFKSMLLIIYYDVLLSLWKLKHILKVFISSIAKHKHIASRYIRTSNPHNIQALIRLSIKFLDFFWKLIKACNSKIQSKWVGWNSLEMCCTGLFNDIYVGRSISTFFMAALCRS